MRIGSLVYATEQGLGILARQFVEEGLVTDVAVVSHGRRPERTDWYQNPDRCCRVSGLRGGEPCKEVRDLIDRVDVMLFFETPFDWSIIPHCRRVNKPTVLMPMYECLPLARLLPYQPDYFLCPSKLDQLYFPSRSQYLPVPVPTRHRTGGVQWRHRVRAEVFVHNAGWGGLAGRNGTDEVLTAFNNYVKRPAKLILNTQKPLGYGFDNQTRSMKGGPTIQVRTGTFPQEALWAEGDVFLFPERFNGLSLPIQEARAAGMLVMATYRFPFNDWLPDEPLISPRQFGKGSVAKGCVEVDMAIHDPKLIAEKVDEYYGRDISEYSLGGKTWAEQNSWPMLRPAYDDFFERVLARDKVGV